MMNSNSRKMILHGLAVSIALLLMVKPASGASIVNGVPKDVYQGEIKHYKESKKNGNLLVKKVKKKIDKDPDSMYFFRGTRMTNPAGGLSGKIVYAYYAWLPQLKVYVELKKPWNLKSIEWLAEWLHEITFTDKEKTPLKCKLTPTVTEKGMLIYCSCMTGKVQIKKNGVISMVTCKKCNGSVDANAEDRDKSRKMWVYLPLGKEGKCSNCSGGRKGLFRGKCKACNGTGTCSKFCVMHVDMVPEEELTQVLKLMMEQNLLQPHTIKRYGRRWQWNPALKQLFISYTSKPQDDKCESCGGSGRRTPPTDNIITTQMAGGPGGMFSGTGKALNLACLKMLNSNKSRTAEQKLNRLGRATMSGRSNRRRLIDRLHMSEINGHA